MSSSSSSADHSAHDVDHSAHDVDYWSGNPSILLMEGSLKCHEWAPDPLAFLLDPHSAVLLKETDSTTLDMLGTTKPPPGLLESPSSGSTFGREGLMGSRAKNLVIMCTNVPVSMTPSQFCDFLNMRTNVFYHTRVLSGSVPGEYLILMALTYVITPRQANLLLREYRKKPFYISDGGPAAPTPSGLGRGEEVGTTVAAAGAQHQQENQAIEGTRTSSTTALPGGSSRSVNEGAGGRNYPELWWVSGGKLKVFSNSSTTPQVQRDEGTTATSLDPFLDFFPHAGVMEEARAVSRTLQNAVDGDGNLSAVPVNGIPPPGSVVDDGPGELTPPGSVVDDGAIVMTGLEEGFAGHSRAHSRGSAPGGPTGANESEDVLSSNNGGAEQEHPSAIKTSSTPARPIKLRNGPAPIETDLLSPPRRVRDDMAVLDFRSNWADLDNGGFVERASSSRRNVRSSSRSGRGGGPAGRRNSLDQPLVGGGSTRSSGEGLWVCCNKVKLRPW